jgi:ribosomal protein S27AE
MKRKFCGKCGQLLPEDHFAKSFATQSGRRGHCKECDEPSFLAKYHSVLTPANRRERLIAYFEELARRLPNSVFLTLIAAEFALGAVMMYFVQAHFN